MRVWKTTDGGKTWKPVSDGFFGGSIGVVAVAAWDPNVVYASGGEKTVRGNVSHGDGIWKSSDAGKTWKPVGLSDSRHIPRIRIHPRDPDLVYAAVLGHLFGPNPERGVYRSKDGGETWQRWIGGSFLSDARAPRGRGASSDAGPALCDCFRQSPGAFVAPATGKNGAPLSSKRIRPL